MKTICGIDVALLASGPTPDEVAAIVANQHSDWQGNFFAALARHFNAMGVGRDRQMSFIATRIEASEDEDAITLIHDLEWWINNETKKKHEEEASP